ncbi:MAG: Ig-like domain-containing protein [Bacteroidota bacterium]|nr:Ig-like domain-containing protein [Bacteroidota bacterium]
MIQQSQNVIQNFSLKSLIYKIGFYINKRNLSKSLVFLVLILIQFLINSKAFAVNYHISVSGKSSGEGSSNNPWDIVTAFSGTKGAPGDTLWLHGGVYKGHFISKLNGSTSANIVVAQYPGEMAILDGSINLTDGRTLTVEGSYTTFYGFQVINSGNNRISTLPGSSPRDLYTNTGIHVVGNNVKLLNLIIRDVVGIGIGFWKGATNSEIYGNIIYNNGWQGSDRGHGHGIYTQNDSGTKYIKDNIIFGGFGRGIQIYGVNGGLQGYEIDGNVIFNSGSLAKSPTWNIIIGGETAADRINIKNNYLYKSLSTKGNNVQVHFSNSLNGSLGFMNNVVVGGDAIVSIKDWQKVNFTGNTLYGSNKVVDFHVNTEYLNSYTWNNNTYHTPNSANSMDGLTYDTWKKWYPYDGSSTFSTSKPSNSVIIKPNQYEKGLGNIVIFNHQELTSVDVDLSKILAIGAEYEIRDVENYNGLPIITGKYNGGTLRLPMNLTTTDKPNGISNVSHSDPNFGVFVVRTASKTSSPVIANNPPTLNSIANPAEINEDALSQTVNLSGITAGAGENQTLKVTATSDNVTLLPHPKVIYTSPNTTGTLVYQPSADRWGSANITVRVDDGGATNNSITRTFQVTVNPINDAPTLNAFTNLNIQGNSSTQTVNISGISSGPFENQKLTITASSSNTALIPHPTVIYTSPNATGSILFAPLANQLGTSTITVRVTDEGSGTSPHINSFVRTFTVTVGALNYVNKIPTLNNINNPASINEDAPEQTINLSGISAGEGESQKLTVTATCDNPTLFPLITVGFTSPNATGTLIFKPAANRSGVATFTVTVNDGAAENNIISKKFTVTVNEINDAPQLNLLANLSIASNSPAKAVSLSGINAGPFENQTLVVKATSSNTTLIPTPTISYSSSNTTGTLTFTPAANQTGSAVISVQVIDNGSGTSPHINNITRNFTVTVADPVNVAPTLNIINNPAEINEDALDQIINLSGISAGGSDNQTLVVTATSDNVTLIPAPKINYTSPNNSGTITYRPAANRSGVANITVKVEDGATLNNVITRTFAVKVNPINDPPTLNTIANLSLVINTAPQTVNLSGITSGPLENQILSIVATSSNTSLIPNPTIEYTSPNNTGKLVFTTLANQTGTSTITIRVSDNGSNDAPNVNIFTRAFTVVVSGSVASLLSPTINTIVNQNLMEDAPTQTVQLLGISAGSGNSQLLKVTATSNNTVLIPNPSIEYIAPNNYGALKFKPLANKFGQATITVKVENGSATDNSATTSFVVDVLPVNDAPTLNTVSDLTLSINAIQQTVNLTGITAGPGETQSIMISAASSNTSLIPTPTVIYSSPNTAGSLRIQPVANASGTSRITVRVTDNGSNTAPNINFMEISFNVNVSSTVTKPEVSAFQLINVANGQEITELQNGATLYTSNLPVPLYRLNINAIVTQQFDGSVVFGFNGNPKYCIENYAAYAIAGNTGATFHNWNNGLAPGKNTISATTFSAKGGIGIAGTTNSITITIIDDAPTNATLATVSKLYLVDADSDEIIVELEDNMVIEAKDLPVDLKKLNIRASLDSETKGSIVFGMDNNQKFNVENNAPYLLGGDTYIKKSVWEGFSPGSKTITATPYSELDGQGKEGIPYKVTFLIKNTVNYNGQAPKVMPIIRSIPESDYYQFIKEDFKTAFVDNNGHHLKIVKIVTLPLSGKLVIKGSEVIAGQEINTEELRNLTYKPNNKNTEVDVFSWNGSNGTTYADDVASVNLIPTKKLKQKVEFVGAKFWPNPVQEKLSVSFIAQAENTIQIYVNDLNGQLLKSFTSKIDAGENELMLNVDDMKKGIYMVTLVNHFNKLTFKMVKD